MPNCPAVDRLTLSDYARIVSPPRRDFPPQGGWKLRCQPQLVAPTYGSHRRVIRVGRFAGQYAKPRSADVETRDDVTLPSFRGNLSTHFPWIGDRTRHPDGAHVELFRGIANPVGVKAGPSCTPEELVELAGILNPENEPGRLTVIHRSGAGQVEKYLPPLIQAVQRAGAHVVWCCDPMHGNTLTTADGVKTRDFEEILGELTQAFAVHHRMGTCLGGVHFELTGENVTECIGGARGLTEAELSPAYHSDVDPRLNYEQALETALLIARQMSPQNGQRIS